MGLPHRGRTRCARDAASFGQVLSVSFNFRVPLPAALNQRQIVFNRCQPGTKKPTRFRGSVFCVFSMRDASACEENPHNCLIYMVGGAGFEPATLAV
jgi:hypothetical protein